MKKRILSLALAVLMLVSLLPLNVVAEGESVTRVEWLQKLIVAFDMEVAEDNYPDNYFSDISSDDDFYRDIMVATHFGFVDTEPGEAFEPNAAATREFAAHTLSFALGLQLDEGTAYTFSDTDAVTYADDVQIAVNRGWFKLVDGAFEPTTPITAAEAEAMLADAEKVLAERVISADHKNSVTYVDGVKAFPESEIGIVEADGTLVIRNASQTVSAGDIIAVWVDQIPNIYSVKSAEKDENTKSLRVTGEKLDSTNYIESMSIAGTSEADIVDFEAEDDVIVTYIFEDGTETQDQKLAKYGSKKVKDINLGTTLKLGGVKVTITGKLSSLTANWEVNWGFFKVQSAYVTLNGKATFSADAKAGGSTTVRLGEQRIAGVGKVTVDLILGLDGSITANFSTDFEAGFSYSEYSGFSVAKYFSAQQFSLHAKANVQAGYKIAFSISDLPHVSAGVSANIGVNMQAWMDVYPNQKPQTCVDMSSWAYLSLNAHASLDGVGSWNKAVTIWDVHNSPIKVHQHWEDDVPVDACTIGSPCANHGYGGGYFTGADSAYYNCGGPNQSSYGYNKKAEPYTIFEYTLDEYKNATITKYYGNVSAVLVPATLDGYKVTKIGENAFKGQYFSSLSFSDGIESIGNYAFENCYNLNNINFADSITSIGEFAFKNCDQLTYVALPNNLKTLCGMAFEDCNNLNAVVIPSTIEGDCVYWSAGIWDECGPFTDCDTLETVTFADGINSIPGGLLAGCTGLKSIKIPDTVTTINWKAFYLCTNLESVEFPEGLTTIGNEAFAGCTKLKTPTFPASLTSIGDIAFQNCNSFDNIILPDNLTTLGGLSFSNCANLRSVYIPAKITGDCRYWSHGIWAGDGPFSNCSALKTVTFAEGINNIATGLFAGCTGLESIKVPDTVTTIHREGFSRCKNLESVELPEGLTTIDVSAFEDCINLKSLELPKTLTGIGAYAFKNCDTLENVKLPDSLTILSKNAFESCDKLNEVYIPARITGSCYSAFADCGALKTVTFAEGINNIPEGLFQNCTGLESIKIPATVTTINKCAFEDAKNLESVELPESLTTINGYAFRNCINLKSIVIPNAVDSMGTYVFSGCTSLESAVLPNIRRNITEGTFQNCTSLKSIELPDTLEAIRAKAFYNCDALESIVVPNNVTVIEERAFQDCDALKTVQLGKSVQTIGNSAFENCDALTDINLPYGLTKIGEYAFYDSDALVDIVIPNSVTSIGKYCFDQCEMLKNITLSTNLKTIPDHAFFQCPALEKIIIPHSVTKIEQYAFANNTALVDAFIPASVTEINSLAFSYNENFTIRGVAGSAAETYANSLGCKFEAVSKAAESATVSKTEIKIAKGSSVKLSATVSPADFTDNYAWKSSNTEVVTVDNTGLVKAVGVGEAKVSFIAGNVKASCTVTVYQGATGISVSQKIAELDPGETVTLSATVKPDNVENKSYTWSSSDESIAKVDADGTVTAVAAGKADIIATSDDNNSLTAKCTVTVRDVTVAESAQDIQSEHPYAVNSDKTWKYTLPGASELNVTFSAETSVEEGSDYIYIYTGDGTEVGKYTGTELAGKTVTVPGDTVRIKLTSDSVMCEYGFAVTDISTGHVHSYTDTVTAPTCTAQGYTTHTCDCGESYVDTYVDALGHKTEVKNARAATCTEEGYSGDEVCAVCGVTVKKGAKTDPLGHSYKDGVCTVCGAKEALPGDLNGDGKVNILDLIRLKKYLAGAKVELVGSADVTGDGKVNILDLIRLKKYLAGAKVELVGSTAAH